MFSLTLSSSSDLGKNLSEAFMPEKVNFFGIDVSPSMITAIIVSMALILIAAILHITVVRKMTNVPSRTQAFLEMLVSGFSKMAKEDTKEYSNIVGAYIFSAAIFICVTTLLDLWGIRPAFADINTCLAFGIASFIFINIVGYRKKGLIKRIGRYKNPILIITDMAVPVSLSIRLFGSIISGFLIMRLLYSFIFTSFVLPAGIAVITVLLHAFIQAYVYAILTTLFIGEALE